MSTAISIDTYRPEIVRRAYEIIGPFIVNDVGGGVKYICYTPDDENGKRVIERVTESSSGGATLTTIEHGYGEWANPGDITYYPINQAIPVEVEG